MAPTSRRSNSQTGENGNAKKSKNGKKEPSQQNQWVFIANDEIVSQGEGAGPDNQPSICKLRHPRTGTATCYLVSSAGSIYELQSFNEKFHSWFIDDTVHSDGQIYLTTPVDPLFLALPYLINASKKERFMSVDQIVCDEEISACGEQLLNTLVKEQLQLVADVKEIDDDLCFYRYSKSKTLSWLKSKVESVAQTLESNNVEVSSKGSHSAIFVASKAEKTSKESYIQFAAGLVSDNLSLELEGQLQEFLGIDATVSEIKKSEVREGEPPAKKAKTSCEVGPEEDYSNGMEKLKAKSQNVKLTVAQKKLSKVDKSGMKSISSFFAPKK